MYTKTERRGSVIMHERHIMGGSPGELVTQEKRKKGLRINCDVGEATEGLENELSGELS